MTQVEGAIGPSLGSACKGGSQLGDDMVGSLLPPCRDFSGSVVMWPHWTLVNRTTGVGMVGTHRGLCVRAHLRGS